MRRPLSGIICRLSWLAIALLVLLTPILAPLPAAGQDTPDPRPEGTVYFHDADGLFTEDQLTTFRRDGKLLQSTGIPTLVYVRAVPADAARSESQAFADQLRREWQVESSEGADDGLVLLFSWVPQNPVASTTVLSYGAHTFDESGLSPESIQETIDTSVRSLVEQEKPFEAVLYLMRETRYTGIYAPPPPSPVEGSAETIHEALRWLGPALAVVAVVTLGTLTRAFWRVKPTTRRVREMVAIATAGAFALWLVSVYARSEVGVASSLFIVAALALAAWTWSRLGFARHGSRPVRRRAVPATSTLMRRRRQARAMLARQAGAGR